MTTLNLTPDVSETLQRAFGPDLDRAAVEALAIEGYRTEKLTAGEVARILGLETSIAAQTWLSQRGVELNYSVEDLHADRAALARHFPEMAL
jgi:predicted HTH domain antitoxin